MEMTWRSERLAQQRCAPACAALELPRSGAPCSLLKERYNDYVTRTCLARFAKRTSLRPALLTLLQRQRQATTTLREVGCQLLISRQEPLPLGEIALHAFHLVHTPQAKSDSTRV